MRFGAVEVEGDQGVLGFRNSGFRISEFGAEGGLRAQGAEQTG